MDVAISTQESILKKNMDYTLFSWSKQGGLNPINIEKAKGCYMWDRDGKKYPDFKSSLTGEHMTILGKRLADDFCDLMREHAPEKSPREKAA